MEEEGTTSTFRALKEVFSKQGLPMSLYTDRGSHYFHKSKAGEIDRDHRTQLDRALMQLGVEHISARSRLREPALGCQGRPSCIVGVQTLTHHPHVHCLVPGGGVALDGQRWVACKTNFLLSVRALSKTFRRLFLNGLEAAFRRSEPGFFGALVPRAEVAEFAERVHGLRQSSFVVYAKLPFGGPERVLAYLARYTHRTAIANSRLDKVDDDPVAFSYKDYRRGVMRLMRCIGLVAQSPAAAFRCDTS